jgi:hypothetical protein
MKRPLILLILVTLLAGCNKTCPPQAPRPSGDYDSRIIEAERRVRELRAEKEAVNREQEQKTTYVSVWALCEAGRKMRTIVPTQAGDFTIYCDAVEEATLRQWLDAALKLDQDSGTAPPVPAKAPREPDGPVFCGWDRHQCAICGQDIWEMEWSYPDTITITTSGSTSITLDSMPRVEACWLSTSLSHRVCPSCAASYTERFTQAIEKADETFIAEVKKKEAQS